MASIERALRDLQGIVDGLMGEADPAQRLLYIQQLKTEAARILTWARDEAAYDAKVAYAGEDIQMLTRIERKNVELWAKRWRHARGLPVIPHRRRKIRAEPSPRPLDS